MEEKGLDELEKEIIETAYAYYHSQQEVMRLERIHGKGKSKKSPSPTASLKREAMKSIGLGEEEIKRYEEVVKKKQKKLEELVREHAVWIEWAEKVKGLGPILTGLMMAAIGDVTRVDNASGLWKSFGLHVEKGRAVKRKPGVASRVGFPFARAVLGRVRITIFKVGVRSGGYYYNLYLSARKKYDRYHPDWPEGRRLGAAIRYFQKVLLSHFWQVWRESKGLPAPPPYIIAKNYITAKEREPHQFISPTEAKEKR